MVNVVELSENASIALYLFIIIAAILLMHIAEKQEATNQKVLIVITFLIIAMPSAFRYNVGTDYAGYTKIYQNIIKIGDLSNIPDYYPEYSFRILSLLSDYLIGSPQILFIFYAILTQIFILSGIYYYRNDISMGAMTFIYMCLFFFPSMNIARQMLSIAIIFYASRFIIEKSFFKYSIFVLLAFIFHNSAIFAFWFYCIAIDRGIINRIMHISKYILPIILIFFMPHTIKFIISLGLLDYSAYPANQDFSLGFGILAMLVNCVLLCVNYKKGLLNGTKTKQFFIVQTMVFATIFFLTEYTIANFGGRISLYLRIFLIVALPLLAYSGNRKENGIRYDYQLIPYIYPCLSIYITIMRDLHSCIPYSLWIGQ